MYGNAPSVKSCVAPSLECSVDFSWKCFLNGLFKHIKFHNFIFIFLDKSLALAMKIVLHWGVVYKMIFFICLDIILGTSFYISCKLEVFHYLFIRL